MKEVVVVAKIVESRTTKKHGIKVTLSGYRVEDGEVKMEPAPKVSLAFASVEQADEEGYRVGAGFTLSLKPANETLPVAMKKVKKILKELKDDGVEIKVTRKKA